MNFTQTEIKGAYLIEPEIFRDDRGEFFRTYDELLFEQTGLKKKFIQFNHSLNYKAGTWRGFHFQLPPKTETKLIRCVAGKIFDVVLDLRKGSPTFLQWKGFELSAENRKQLLIPDGCAHGFVTLEDFSAIIYHHTELYDSAVEAGVRYDDPKINLSLPVAVTVVSERDRSFPYLLSDYKGIPA